jgi:hypothetical protein
VIFHFSIAADDPKRTATMLAELWRGQAFYFPMVGKGSWVAHAGDDRRTTIEVYPRDLAFYPNEAGEGHQRNEPFSRHGPFRGTGRFTRPSRRHFRSRRCRRLAGDTGDTRSSASAVRSA